MDSYWHSRQTLADAAMEKDERALSIRVHNAYESELRRLNREIAEYYQRYGENGVLEYRRLMETMDPKDRELLIRDCDEFLRQHPDMQSIVDVRKSIYKLNRLEGLQASARLHLYQATGDVVQRIDNHIMRQSLRGANTAAEAMGFGRSFYSMDSDAVRRFVDTVWTGNTSYSQRIWDNTETLASYVAQDMSKALARGDSYQRIAKALEKRFVDVPQSSLMRLVYTEGTYVSRMAQVEELKREGFDSYTIEVVHDERACEECEGVNGSTFRFEDMQVGVNFPPLHPYCRCQIAPAVNDWGAWQQKQEELGQRDKTPKQVEKAKENTMLRWGSKDDKRAKEERIKAYTDRIRDLDSKIVEAAKKGQNGLDRLLSQISPDEGMITTQIGAKFDGKELNVAIRLADMGSDVSFIKASSKPGSHTPDMLKDGVPVEIKRVESSSVKRLFKKMWEASSQSRDIVIDLSLESISEQDAEKTAKEFLETPLSRYQSNYEKKHSTGNRNYKKQIRADSVTLMLHDKVITVKR